jgi:hypothetical protein
MKMWKWMSMIAVLAIVIWLSLPAIRIWRDPNLLSHRHTLRSLDSMRQLEWVVKKPATATTMSLRTNVLSIDHRPPFWDRYRTLLLGQDRPPGEGCAEWSEFRGQIQLEGSKADEKIGSNLVAESISIVK